MFSKEDLMYASPRMNMMAPSKTSFLIRDILGSNTTTTTTSSLFDCATSGTAGGTDAAAAATAAGIAALVALRGAAAGPGWTSAVGPAEPQTEPPPGCCGGFLLGCVTVPCLSCATSPWNAAGYPDLSSTYLPGGGSATSWPSSAFPISPAVSSVEALAGSGFPAQQQALPLSPSTSDALQAAGRELRKARRNRTVFTEGQLMGLERRFDSQKYLSTPDRADLARVLGLTQLQVKTWYQNRRMKWKKQVMQGGCAVPPTKPKGRPKKNSIPSLAQCQQAQRQLALAAASARQPAATDSMASFDTRNGYPR
ncbi:homeobox protein BarH-like 2 [Rhipicephalus sanguineus]|uniref:Homeobox domain-containing protein n=1 Tax=Rhipicephalus sanguineus TaxID=34632 RepID=A0A9D4PTK6_RHISA|nr:homeobox protein BarH-like 2 [Rhipicephalus sanguineus]KAH7952291.1 hypothetical protein HPB52_021430 [Rhipicephalus sanguineus]